jgi:hypothetical protein
LLVHYIKNLNIAMAVLVAMAIVVLWFWRHLRRS